MVSTCPLNSKSSSPCINPFVTVPRAHIIIGITVTFMFHSFFNSQDPGTYDFFSISFNFTLWSAETVKSIIRQILFFLLIIIRSGHYYYYNYYSTLRGLFTSEIAGRFSLESKWQQVSSDVQDSSEYSGQSQLGYNLDSFVSSIDFQILSKLMGNVQSTPSTIGINLSPLFPCIFTFLARSKYYYHYYCEFFFYQNITWWFFSGVTARLLRSPGLFSEFWSILSGDGPVFSYLCSSEIWCRSLLFSV